MSEGEVSEDQEFWQALYEILQDARDSLPYFAAPERVHWTHLDEEWKNEAELQSIGDDCATEVEALIEHYCAKHAWPRRSKNNARYFASERLSWAVGFARIFTIPSGSSGTAAIPRPPQSGWELIRWLLLDAYPRRYPPPLQSPFYISGSDGKSFEIWT